MYCRYHYLEGHEFKSPEEELQHFVKKIDDDTTKFKWRHQYEAYEEMAEGEGKQQILMVVQEIEVCFRFVWAENVGE